jgi:ABC-type polar amino acid transport system ATPase subunit
MLDVNNLVKIFKNNPVLSNINFSLEKGTITAILGSSGSGKSTLLRCLARLEKVDRGSLTFNGQPLESLRACATGMVFQGFNLFPHLSIIENLVHAPILLKRMSKHKALSQAENWLNIFNLSDKIHESPANLSGGQKQRVAIARTMMMEPSIILLDEPTSALDPEMVNEVAALVKSLKSADLLIIIATHELRLAKLAADQILFLDNGILVEQACNEKFFYRPETPRAQLFLKNLLAF